MTAAPDPVQGVLPLPSGENSLHISLEGFEGPLDLLLDLARAQKVDLARISIVALVDQYLAVIEGARRIRLELAADWLVMAAWLAWLKSRLLLPEDPDHDEEDDPQLLAERLAERLVELEAMREAARRLNRLPQLGQEVFARGMPERLVVEDRSGLSADLPALLQGYIVALRRSAAKRPYRPKPRKLLTVQDALERLARIVGELPEWGVLQGFVPDELVDPVERKAALASTLIAGLEMAKGGALELRQDEAFGPIMLRRQSAAPAEPAGEEE
ncbi:segregation/condensation protein A [Acetobacteraceae bacterium H6797]|nr:segregation/condensation protein A [Acetobacteraceae bacterium H6797]